MIPSSEFWAICCFFGAGDRPLRLQHYRTFRRSLRAQNVPLLCVELAEGNQQHLLGPADAELLIQRRSSSLLWQKERLLNLALTLLPSSCKKICWLDCDIVFLNNDWAEHTCALLEEVEILQAFDTVFRTPESFDLSRYCHPDFDWSDVPYWYNLPEGCQLRSSLFVQQHETKDPWSPGYAWAVRRELLDALGFYDYCIVGGADQLIADGITGRRLRKKNLYYEIPSYAPSLSRYQSQLAEAVDGKFGFTPGRVLHLYHGSYQTRKYEERAQMLLQHQFDPERDLRQVDGIWEWARRDSALEEEVRRYFLSREEDEAQCFNP